MLPVGSFISVSCFPRAFCSLLFLVQDDFELLVVKRFVTNTLCFVMFCLRGCRGRELRTVSFLSAFCFFFSIWRSSAGKTKSLFVFVAVVVSVSFLVSPSPGSVIIVEMCGNLVVSSVLFWVATMCLHILWWFCLLTSGKCLDRVFPPCLLFDMRFSSFSNFPNSRLHRAAPVLSFFPPFTSLCWNNNAAEKKILPWTLSYTLGLCFKP